MKLRSCLLIMNGRSTRGAEARFCGFTDPPLSNVGRQHLLTVRQNLLNEKGDLPQTWFISDRRRAIETFETLSAGLSAPNVTIDKSLREINFGAYENLTWEELPREFQKQYEKGLENPLPLRFPDGESFGDLCERVSQGALRIIQFERDNETIAIVAHQGSLRIWMMIANDINPNMFFNDIPQMGTFYNIKLSSARIKNWRKKYLKTS